MKRNQKRVVFVQKWRINIQGRKPKIKYSFHLNRLNLQETESRKPIGRLKEQHVSNEDYYVIERLGYKWSTESTHLA